MRVQKQDSPELLLEMARSLLAAPRNDAGVIHSRAAAHLARQALEGALAMFWQERSPGVEMASTRAQLICLPRFLKDEETAGRVAYAWAALSRACHHHAYELAPAATEIKGWLEVVESLTERISSG